MNKKTVDRMKKKLNEYSKIALSLRKRDVSEADTVTVVKDILSDVFGFDKYLELTGEYEIRGKRVDLAVTIQGKVKYLIEVKAAGIDLKDNHLTQALNYAVNEGIEWVVLTNSISWNLYRVKFAKPIDKEEIVSFSINEIDLRKTEDQKKVFLLTREAANNGAMEEYHYQTQIINPYTFAHFITQTKVLNAIRSEFRKTFTDIKINNEQIHDIILDSIFKREITEGDKAKEMVAKIKRINNKIARTKLKESAKSQDHLTIEPEKL